MLGGAHRNAVRMTHAEDRPYMWKGGNFDKKPDWENAPYVYQGSPNRSSFNHTQPKAYVHKDERPSVTGLYKREEYGNEAFFNMMAAYGSKAIGKSAGTTRGK